MISRYCKSGRGLYVCLLIDIELIATLSKMWESSLHIEELRVLLTKSRCQDSSPSSVPSLCSPKGPDNLSHFDQDFITKHSRPQEAQCLQRNKDGLSLS